MAELGPSKAEAVDRIQQKAGLGVSGGLDTSGASYSSLAERVLDDVTQTMQVEGTAGNVYKNQLHTPSGSPTVVNLDSTVLHIQATGISEGRSFSAVDGQVFDNQLGSATLPDAQIQIHEWRELPWAKIPPVAKFAIIDRAAVELARRHAMNPARDTVLAEQASNTDRLLAGLALPNPDPMPARPTVTGPGFNQQPQG